ncbi:MULTISPECIES: FMN-binding negative transcriptional regulator [unclassified Psychrobacter]|uniref:FMN-binding negative transcriptional regulator n=1 Tax=unclassified Psychrobacter TaxID=196806 RepID=UPI00040C66B7|nr:MULTISPECIES: FMN-binding negative transcriptional regulator [unclassified Psychrobacter]
MHIPSVFCEEDFDNIIDFIAAKPLATIIAQTNKGIEACHIPLFWYKDNANINSQYGYLYGHFGRKNPIYLDALADTSWLIIFQDSGHYVSPNWYPSKANTHKEVPTWNYQSVHIQSKIELLEDTAKLKWILATTTAQQEIVSDNPWSLEDAPTAYIDAMCRGIIGFRFAIDSVQAQFKLSQNKTADNIAGVIKGLEHLDTNDALAMAAKVAAHNSI